MISTPPNIFSRSMPIIVWIIVSLFSFYLVQLKYEALDFHTRDYAYYTGFITQWGSPNAYFSLNPGGYNFLGTHGVDGCDGFYQWIHLEPVRFLQAGIYRLFHSMQAVFLFNSLVVCSPVWMLLLCLNKAGAGTLEKLAWLLLCIGFPSFLLTAGFDNRPVMFLLVVYSWMIYFILYSKKKWTHYLFFILLFMVREEAIILHIFTLSCFWLQGRKKKYPVSIPILATITWVVYGIVLLAYFNYWNYTFFSFLYIPKNALLLVMIGAAFFFCLACIILTKAYEYLLFLPFFIFFLPAVNAQVLHLLPEEGYNLYNTPRNLFWFLPAICFLLYRRSRQKKWSLVFLFLFLPWYITGYILPKNIFTQYPGWQKEKRSASLIIHYKETYPVEEKIFTDYRTHVLFCENPHSFCVDRLPCTVSPGGDRMFPANKAFLLEMIRPGDVMALEKSTLTRLAEEGILLNFEVLNENDAFVVLRIKETYAH